MSFPGSGSCGAFSWQLWWRHQLAGRLYLLYRLHRGLGTICRESADRPWNKSLWQRAFSEVRDVKMAGTVVKMLQYSVGSFCFPSSLSLSPFFFVNSLVHLGIASAFLFVFSSIQPGTRALLSRSLFLDILRANSWVTDGIAHNMELRMPWSWGMKEVGCLLSFNISFNILNRCLTKGIFCGDDLFFISVICLGCNHCFVKWWLPSQLKIST